MLCPSSFLRHKKTKHSLSILLPSMTRGPRLPVQLHLGPYKAQPTSSSCSSTLRRRRRKPSRLQLPPNPRRLRSCCPAPPSPCRSHRAPTPASAPSLSWRGRRRSASASYTGASSSPYSR